MESDDLAGRRAGSDEPGDRAAVSGLLTAVAMIGGVGLAYEVTLTRIFSIAQWHHFAYMVISVALLGFAVSGTTLGLLRRRIRGRELRLLRLSAFLLALALPGCTALSQTIPFETFQLVVRPVQLWYLLLLYLVLAVPFFLVSSCIVLGFMLAPERVGRVYFANMVGSGVGAAAAVGLLFLLPPARIPYALAIPVALALLVASVGRARPERARHRNGLRRAVAAAALAAVPAIFAVFPGLPIRPAGLPGAGTAGSGIRISEYKGLAYAMDLPDARVVAEAMSPLSVVTAVGSPLLRETPGQISGYPMGELGPLPEQRGIYFDADAVSPVHRYDGAPGSFAFLDFVTSALPYQILEEPRTLVIGAGGGTEVWNAIVHGAIHVTAVEIDPGVLRLVRGPLREFSGGVYERPDVIPVHADGRGYLASLSTAESFDLIQIALLDSFNASAAGVRALSESYLYTIEAVELYLRRLSPGGVLAVTRWLEVPPRDAIKMFATLVEAAERAGIAEPGRHIAFIRSWNTGTLLLSRSPLSATQISAIRRFAGDRGLDLAWLPGLGLAEVNRYTVLDEPLYWQAASRILSADREAFYRDYLFHVRPATDDRPHFSRFFRWSSLPALRVAMGGRWLDLVEWGYLALVATLLQAVVLSLVLVMGPLALATWWRSRLRTPEEEGPARSPVVRVVLYFGALGLAYMFLEIAFIQKLMLFLAYPVYAVAVVLSSFLVFSGLGSAYADRRPAPPGRLVATAVVLIAGFAGLYLLLLPGLFAAWSGWPDIGRIAASLALLSPIAFLMGIPFPSALQLVSDRYGSLVPWAWAVNGAASIVGAVLATLLAVHLGFTAVVGLAVGLYAGAALVLAGTSTTVPSATSAGSH